MIYTAHMMICDVVIARKVIDHNYNLTKTSCSVPGSADMASIIKCSIGHSILTASRWLGNHYGGMCVLGK